MGEGTGTQLELGFSPRPAAKHTELPQQIPGEQTTLASQTRSQRVFYSHPFQDYQHVRVCQSQVAKPSQANARQEPVPATTGLYIGSFLKGLFNFRALSVQLEYLHSLQITTDLLTLTLEQVGFSRGGEGDFPCTACCQLPRAQQGRQSHTHTHPHPQQPRGNPSAPTSQQDTAYCWTKLLSHHPNILCPRAG